MGKTTPHQGAELRGISQPQPLSHLRISAAAELVENVVAPFSRQLSRHTSLLKQVRRHAPSGHHSSMVERHLQIVSKGHAKYTFALYTTHCT